MSMQYISIGRLGKTHGIEGFLKAAVDDRYLEDFFASELVFVDLKGQKVPFFIEDIQEGHAILVKFEEYDDKEMAQELCGKELFLRPEDLLPEAERSANHEDNRFERFIGFAITDTSAGNLGQIEDIMELPQQFMAVVILKGKETLIPLHPDLILHIDEEKRLINMTLPEGLLDL